MGISKCRLRKRVVINDYFKQPYVRPANLICDKFQFKVGDFVSIASYGMTLEITSITDTTVRYRNIETDIEHQNSIPYFIAQLNSGESSIYKQEVKEL